MPRTSCQPLIDRPRTRRSTRIENPYRAKKNDPKKVDVKEKDEMEQKTVDPTFCLLCNSKINVEDRRFFRDIQYHYTICYFRHGQFREIIPPINSDENKRQYICSQQGCSMREMRYKEFCVHEGIAHRKTQQLMARDSRPGLKNILSQLYPVKKDIAEQNDSKGTKMTVNPRHLSHSESSKKKLSTINFESTRTKNGNKSTLSADFSRREEEEVDDPSNPGLSCQDEVLTESKEGKPWDFVDDPDEDFVTPDLIKPHNCFICDGRGRGSRDGRNFNLGTHLSEVKYHYAQCYYTERKLLSIIDTGPLNRNQDGSPIDEIGTQFKYRCPFPTCAHNNATRGGKKTFGYKEYSLHLAKDHHLLEVVLANERRAGAAEVRAAIVQARRREGGLLERVPEVQFEEVHVCLVCNGENKEGKNLSFDPMKIKSLRYHYASCLYDTGVYLQNYSKSFQLDKHEEHEKNIGEDGKPKDVIGTIYKYTCKEKKCTLKRKIGFKEYCIHTANEHGIVIQVMLKSEREELRKVGLRLKEIFD